MLILIACFLYVNWFLIKKHACNFLARFVGVASYTDVCDNQATVKQSLVSAYKSNLADKLKAEVHENDNHLQDGESDKQFAGWATTWWQQFAVLFRRGVKERRHESFSSLKIGQILIVALLAGLLWWQSDTSHLQDQVKITLPHEIVH